ncbi:hypothetical protein DFH27DRAFT_621515, partial [Peziza echinospora]
LFFVFGFVLLIFVFFVLLPLPNSQLLIQHILHLRGPLRIDDFNFGLFQLFDSILQLFDFDFLFLFLFFKLLYLINKLLKCLPHILDACGIFFCLHLRLLLRWPCFDDLLSFRCDLRAFASLWRFVFVTIDSDGFGTVRFGTVRIVFFAFGFPHTFLSPVNTFGTFVCLCLGTLVHKTFFSISRFTIFTLFPLRSCSTLSQDLVNLVNSCNNLGRWSGHVSVLFRRSMFRLRKSVPFRCFVPKKRSVSWAKSVLFRRSMFRLRKSVPFRCFVPKSVLFRRSMFRLRKSVPFRCFVPKKRSVSA